VLSDNECLRSLNIMYAVLLVLVRKKAKFSYSSFFLSAFILCLLTQFKLMMLSAHISFICCRHSVLVSGWKIDTEIGVYISHMLVIFRQVFTKNPVQNNIGLIE
jgi:hypothetical protein